MDENPRHALHHVYRSVHKRGTLSVKAELVGQAYNNLPDYLPDEASPADTAQPL